MPPAIGLIVTGANTLRDYKIFVKTLEVWHPDAELYIFTDSAWDSHIKALKTSLKVQTRTELDKYTGKTRAEMEAVDGKIYKTLWTDFMYEKAAVLDWMFEACSHAAEGLWFMDADICHLAPLPSVPESATVGLCPHYIREADWKRFGKYNGGFMWIKDRSLLDIWKTAGHTARYFEQSAMEVMGTAAGDKLYEFPIQVNFGWWRMIQSPLAPPEVQKKFTIYRPDKSVGVRYDGVALQSVHTHWYETSAANGAEFNRWFGDFIRKLASHPPMRNFIKTIGI